MQPTAFKRQSSVEGKIIMRRKHTEDILSGDKNGGQLLEFDHQVDANVGTTLSDFKILSELGKGSYGTVFKAQSLLDQKEYVIKKINIKHLKPKHQREAQKEVQILRKVQHANIIRYYSSFMEEDCLYIVMEYAEGGDLQMYIKNFKDKSLNIPEQEIWNFAYECCQAVDYLHNNNIMHRDLKTLNVFLTKDKKIKIGDMGVSKIVPTKLALQGTRVGTPLYLAPELVKQQPYDQKIDVWALGCVFYHLAAQEPPFIGDNLISLGYNIVNKSPKPLASYYSPRLSSFILKFLEKNPQQRAKISDLWDYFPLQRSATLNVQASNPNPRHKPDQAKSTQDRVEIAESKQNRLYNQLILSDNDEKGAAIDNLKTEEKPKVQTPTAGGPEGRSLKLDIKDLKPRPESAKMAKESISRNVTERSRNTESENNNNSNNKIEEKIKNGRPQSSNINQVSEKKQTVDEANARLQKGSLEKDVKVSSQKTEQTKSMGMGAANLNSAAAPRKAGEDQQINSPVSSPSYRPVGKQIPPTGDKVTKLKTIKQAWTEENGKNDGGLEKKGEALNAGIKNKEEEIVKANSRGIQSEVEARKNDVPYEEIPVIYEDVTDDDDAEFKKEYQPIKKESVLQKKENSNSEATSAKFLAKNQPENLMESKQKVTQVIMDFEQRLKVKKNAEAQGQGKKEDVKEDQTKIFKIRPFSAQVLRPGSSAKPKGKKLVLGFNDNFIRLSLENFRGVGNPIKLTPSKRSEKEEKEINQKIQALDMNRPKSAHPALLSKPVEKMKENDNREQSASRGGGAVITTLQSEDSQKAINNRGKPQINEKYVSEPNLTRADQKGEHGNNLIQRWNKAILLNVRGYEPDQKEGPNPLNAQNGLKNTANSVSSPGNNPSISQANQLTSKGIFERDLPNMQGPNAAEVGSEGKSHRTVFLSTSQIKKREDPVIVSQGFHKFKPAWFEDRIASKAAKSHGPFFGIKVEGKSIKMPDKKKFTIKDLY